MVKHLFILLFITSFNYTTEAQIATIFADEFPDSSKTKIGITSNYDLNSTAFTNTFISKFYLGGYINTDLKNTVLNRLKNANQIGGNLNNGVYAAFKLQSFGGSKNISLFFSVRDRLHFDSQFSGDLYKVGFYGNSQFAGQTANFDNFSLNLIHYQQVQIGLFSSKLDSAARWGIGLSFLKGQQYFSVIANKAELFTSEDGQYINFNTDLTAIQSDPAHTGTGALNGYGASLDLYFEAPFQTRFGDSKLRIAVSDIGLIRFNKQTQQYQQDSVFQYSGIRIDNIYDVQSLALGSKAKDSIINAIAPNHKQAYNATLPAILDLTFETHFTKRFHLIEGIHYVFNANYTTLYYVKAHYYFTPKFMLSATFGYGGYGNLNYGIGVFADLGRGIKLYAGSNNIEGYIAPAKTAGQGVYITLVKSFK